MRAPWILLLFFLCLVSLCALKCVMKVDNSWIVVQAILKMDAL